MGEVCTYTVKITSVISPILTACTIFLTTAYFLSGKGEQVEEKIGLADLEEWGLVVVDMQNDFLAAGGYYARRKDLDAQIAQKVLSVEERNRLLSQPAMAAAGEFRYRDESLSPIVANIARAIGYARTRHRPIAYVRAVYSREFDVLPPSLRREPDREHYPCKPHSWGSDFIEPIKRYSAAGHRTAHEKVIEKHTFDGCFQTGLLQFLRDLKVQTVVITGVETHVCVLTTAQSAATGGFKTVILEDCVWTARDELGEHALAIFRDAFGATARLDHGRT
jgi:nicotinamidase-related amidase